MQRRHVIRHAVTDTDDVTGAVDRRPHTDRGVSYVEILVSVVLLGMVVSALLVTLRTSIDASQLNRDHTNAHAWLQTATDVLYGSPREDCGTETASRATEIADVYESILRTTTNPEGWPADNIEVVRPVLFWDGTSQYQTTCYDDSGINLQLITIQVRGLDGRIVESVQVVKG